MSLLPATPTRSRPVVACALTGLAVLAAASFALAVDEQGGVTTARSATGSAVVDHLLAEEAPAPGAYVYRDDGRRDPFRDLRVKDHPEPPAGIHLHEQPLDALALRGVVQSQGGAVAVLAGANGRTYFAHEGDRVRDGRVEHIGRASVDFAQTTQDLGVPRTRTVRRTLDGQ